jgi:MFS transporter, PAT family, beta-lactamase induction signal transducer AmpG
MNEIEAVGAEAALGGEPGDGSVRHDRPWLYSFLIAPSAVVANGVIQGGVLAYLLSEQGIGSGRTSRMMFLLGLPTWLYFLWSPLTDFIVRRRTWILIGGLLAAAAMALSFHQPNLSSTAALSLMLLSACCTQLVVSSCGGMLGAMRLERSRRLGSSFYQAGGMGFGALAAWALVKLSYTGAGRDTLGLTAAAMIAVPTLFALAAPKQEVISEGTFAGTMRRIGLECKATFWRWEAFPYIGCMVFPMASGAAVGLLPGVAKQYGVNGGDVAWMNGLLGGLLMAGGSAVAAILPTRVRASVMYMVVALVNCATLCVLWLGPLRPSTYFLGVTLYLFTLGTCYSMFTAVLLEFLGHSGKSGSGRYSIINSLGNVPVQYMLLVDGWGGDRWGGRGLAGSEAVVGAVGAVILLAYFLTHKRADPGPVAGPVLV